MKRQAGHVRGVLIFGGVTRIGTGSAPAFRAIGVRQARSGERINFFCLVLSLTAPNLACSDLLKHPGVLRARVVSTGRKTVLPRTVRSVRNVGLTEKISKRTHPENS